MPDSVEQSTYVDRSACAAGAGISTDPYPVEKSVRKILIGFCNGEIGSGWCVETEASVRRCRIQCADKTPARNSVQPDPGDVEDAVVINCENRIATTVHRNNSGNGCHD